MHAHEIERDDACSSCGVRAQIFGKCFDCYHGKKPIQKTEIKERPMSLECLEEGCEKKAHSRGLCTTHYARIRRTPDFEPMPRLKKQEAKPAADSIEDSGTEEIEKITKISSRLASAKQELETELAAVKVRHRAKIEAHIAELRGIINKKE